jgi:hypothetical protein
MLVKGLMTQMSGSLGGVTAGHAKGGMYLRARSVPVNPASTYQQQVRAAVASLSQAWGTSLTPVQRAAWNAYGSNVSTTNSVGDTIFLSGQSWYIACNTPRLQADAKLGATLGRIDDAPTVYDRGDTGVIGISDFTETIGLEFTIAGAPDWAADAAAFALIFQGLPGSAGRQFFGGPWRLVQVVPGNAVAITTMQATAADLTTGGWTLTQGQSIAAAVAIAQPDGRLSARQRFGPVIAGA